MKRTALHLLALLICMACLLSACAPAAAPEATPEATGAPAPAETAQAEPAEEPAAALYTPGIYTGVGTGKNGEVKVEVTFDEQSILSVNVTEQSETGHIYRAVAERIPADIVAAQSLNVEAVSGATLSRAAILSAVADCVDQAGGDSAALWSAPIPEVQKNADQSLETDVLIVGSGIAGMGAAIEAAEAGAKVLVIEKLATTSGSSAVSGGKLQASESFLMEQNGSTDTVEDFYQYLMDCSRNLADPEFVRTIAEKSAENVQWLKDMGVDYLDKTVSLHAYRANVARGHLPVEQKGYGYLTPMENKALSLGVTILTETPAQSLITEDGVVKGVNAIDATGAAVVIRAAATILCTGAFDRNPDLMAQYQPLITPYVSSGTVGNTGDGLIMARDAGAEIIARDGCIGNCLDVTFTYMTSTNGGSYQAASTGLFVAGEGKRFVDENNFSFARTAAMLDRGYTCFYSIFDQKSYVEGLERAISMGRAFKADSLAELAAATGMDAATLEATVAQYNELCAAGEDADFHKPAEFMTPVDEGPFYALLHTYVISGTFGGPRVDLNGHVISTKGVPIPGLFAAGEVANAQYLCYEYPGSGSALSSYLTMGRLAGAAAAASVR